MKSLLKRIDRFCALHPNFGIPNLMLYVVIGNLLIWLFYIVDSTGTIINYLAFSPYYILHGQVWRLVTFALIPNSTGYLALITFYFYYFLGSTLEKQWGTGKFTIYFLAGMVLTIVYGFIIYFITGISLSVSAVYIYFSMFFSFATLFPNTQVLLFFIIPIKIKWLGIADALFFLIEIISNPFPYNMLPVVAILNYLIFCGGWLFDYLTPDKFVRNRRQSQRKAPPRAPFRVVSNPNGKQTYTRKCSVCGKTDVDYPDLEFRYCSRCVGFHCFCIDHINSHIHFTE